MFSTATLSDVIEYVTDHADEQDLDRIYAAAKMRTKALRAKVAASVRVGADVSMTGISPKYFEGLTGVVTRIDGDRARVRFDERSTDVLRYKGSRRFFIPLDTKEFETGGFPLSTCKVV